MNCLIVARSVRATDPSLSTSARFCSSAESSFLSTSEIASVERSVTSILPSPFTSPNSVLGTALGSSLPPGFVSFAVVVTAGDGEAFSGSVVTGLGDSVGAGSVTAGFSVVTTGEGEGDGEGAGFFVGCDVGADVPSGSVP